MTNTLRRSLMAHDDLVRLAGEQALLGLHNNIATDMNARLADLAKLTGL